MRDESIGERELMRNREDAKIRLLKNEMKLLKKKEKLFK
jgi:hypothetical protein